MQNLFPGYYRPNEEKLKELWAQGLFVFDTNVLLNLYSYPEAVREVFLSVLSKIQDRMWIPYQVGLEFHRNRFPRIKQANQRVEKLLQTIQSTGNQLNDEVRSIELEKRNIGISDIQERLTAVQAAHSNLSEAVKLACEKLPPVSLDDPIGQKISALIADRVGSPPADQADLDNVLLADAADRFEKKIPPGFADAVKGEETYRDRGITYLSKYGDLILWKQVIAKAKTAGIKKIIFVTGDKKKDWWWIEDGKTLGPLPEMVQEICSAADVELFWMYSADQFLQYAETYLKATEVTQEAVDQVKEVLSRNPSIDLAVQENKLLKILQMKDFTASSFQTRKTDLLSKGIGGLPGSPWASTRNYFTQSPLRNVANWLAAQYPNSEIEVGKDFPDILLLNDSGIHGYEVKQVKHLLPRAFPPGLVHALLRGYLEVHEGRLKSFSVIIVLSDQDDYLFDEDWREELAERAATLLTKYPASQIIVGVESDDIFSEIVRISGSI